LIHGLLCRAPAKGYDHVLSDFLPVFPILSECSPLASDSQKQQFPEWKTSNPLYTAPDIPSLQYVEVHGMVRGHYEAALQGRPSLPLLSLASLQFAWF
jgi:hypothetical protein